MEHIKTLQQAIQYFGDPENCRQFMVFMRWPDGVPACPYCGATKLTWLAKANVYRCYGDHKKQKFSLKVGTVFEDSPIGLDKWLPAIWLLCNAKNGISSYELHRALGVTQKTAWFMLHRIRLAMESETFHKLGGRGGGPVEIDEAFIGPKPQRMHADRRAKMKLASGGKVGIAVMRMLDRELRQVRAKVIPNVKRDLLVSLCEENETQLIATTHSYEFLKAIAPSLEDSRTARNFQLLRLARDINQRPTITKVDGESYHNAILNQFEVR